MSLLIKEQNRIGELLWNVTMCKKFSYLIAGSEYPSVHMISSIVLFLGIHDALLKIFKSVVLCAFVFSIYYVIFIPIRVLSSICHETSICFHCPLGVFPSLFADLLFQLVKTINLLYLLVQIFILP